MKNYGQTRERWVAVRDDTGATVTPPYYVGAPAMKVAKRLANELGVSITVTRNGQPWATYSPAPKTDLAGRPRTEA